MPRHIVFDVNETLLDVSALDPFFERLFGESRPRSEWFLTLQENWLTATILDRFQPFGELAQGALVMVGRRRGIEIAATEQQELVDRLKRLPPHADVAEALHQLRDAGFELAALTNSTLEAARQQLESADLTDHFAEIMSVDEVQRYKPAPTPYLMAAERLGITPADYYMVAAHAWDIAGAASAGCRTAFVTRPGKVLNPVGIQPDMRGDDLLDVARQIIARAR
ncbi:haloacid dehalogenase type II [Halomonas shantousis]